MPARRRPAPATCGSALYDDGLRTFNRDEAADFLKCDRDTLSAMIEAGEVPCAKIGRAYVFMEDDSEAYTCAIRSASRRTLGERR